MIITIDGPSGTGKTTIARGVAKRLGIPYFDTGAMYRAVALLVLRHHVDLKDENQLAKLLETFSFRIEYKAGEQCYFIGGEDVTGQLRCQEINEIVSEVAAIAQVRERLWALQREFGEKSSAVFEGRDMGSVVFPLADVKIFLTAGSKERASRRLEEIRLTQSKEAEQFNLATMEQRLLERDQYDSNRVLAPLICPKGAYVIDTTHMEIEEVIEKILLKKRKAVKKLYPGWFCSKKMKGLYRLVLAITWMLFKGLYRHRVYGLEHYFRGAAIIAPNHTSYLDPPLVAISWPEEVDFLAKEALFTSPFFGRFIRALNAHPVHGDAADVALFKTILKLLKEGKKMILFPEGARSDGELSEIKPGIGLLLARSKTAIIPTYIHGASKLWGRKQKFPKLWGRTVCVFGAPIFWETFASMEKREAQQAIANTLFEKIQNLKSWYEAGAKGTPP